MAAKTELSDLESEINEESKNQQNSTNVVTEDKKQKKKTMIDATFPLCSGTKAYAAFAKNDGLKASVNFSISDLGEGSDQECYNRCKKVYEIVNPLAGALLEYKIKPEMLEKQRVATEEFYSVITAPQEARTEIKNSTEKLDGLFALSNTIFTEKLDPLVAMYEEENPDFYLGYQNARYIGGWSKGDEPEEDGKEGEEENPEEPVK
jgi:hypothetical protein